ncbi:MAG: FKBP-type peptidyl-prolyl cis-trans isomerase [Myxococcota bacterium]
MMRSPCGQGSLRRWFFLGTWFMLVAGLGAGCGKNRHGTVEPVPDDAQAQVAAEDIAPDVAAEDAAAAPDTAPAADGRPSLDPPADLKSPPADAEKRPSGLVTKVLKAGTGDVRPGRDDTVFVHYVAWNDTGKRVGTTWKRVPEPRILRMDKALPGWSQGIGLMVVGETRRLWIPAALAHSRSTPKAERTPLVLDVTLAKLKRAPPAPADLKRPPANATKSASGLTFVELAPGQGDVRPTGTNEVTVRYAGWTQDGRCFDHTDVDETMSFPLGSVIKGWTEGVQQMKPGAKFRFWVLAKLAYDGEQGKPKGTLVFDVELVAIVP